MEIYYWTNTKYLGSDTPPTKSQFKKDYKKLPISIPFQRGNSKMHNLEIAFEVLNGPNEPNPMGHSIYQKWIGENLKPHPHTSMSSGDIIQIGEEYWYVKPFGWKKIKW